MDAAAESRLREGGGGGCDADSDGDGEEQVVVLVTGCARGGIGHEYARSFHAAGCRVFATDVHGPESGAMSDLQALPGVTALKLDVTSSASVEAAVSLVLVRTGGRIDVLVNNAGIGATGPLAETPLRTVARSLEVNVTGVLRVVQAVVPAMARRRRGKIVNVGSVVGLVATPWAGAYCATKAAVHSLTETLRVELRPLGLQVMLVVPGSVRSGLGAANLAALDQEPPARSALYAQYAGAVRARAAASQVGRATPTHDFARAVVAAALRPSMPRHFKYGYLTGLFTLLHWSPLCLRDAFMTMKFMNPDRHV